MLTTVEHLQSLLNQTDFAVLPDVDLVNKEDFIQFRHKIRKAKLNRILDLTEEELKIPHPVFKPNMYGSEL